MVNDDEGDRPMNLRTTILCLTFVSALLGQGRGPAPVRSPEVSADGKVTFRLRTANAKEVAVTGLGERLAM
jgi:hypothetical protein